MFWLWGIVPSFQRSNHVLTMLMIMLNMKTQLEATIPLNIHTVYFKVQHFWVADSQVILHSRGPRAAVKAKKDIGPVALPLQIIYLFGRSTVMWTFFKQTGAVNTSGGQNIHSPLKLFT